MSDAKLDMHQLLRYSKGAASDEPLVSGLPNFFYFTRSRSRQARVQLEAGISAPTAVKRGSRMSVPVLMIRSNPHRAGSASTPWEDYFDTDRGRILFYGDSRAGDAEDAAQKKGNSMLLQQYQLQHSASREDRLLAAPCVFFRGVPYDGKIKGHLRFEGFGVVERAERVTQIDARQYASFTNYRFDFLVMSLKEEGERLSWEWINARRNPDIDAEEALVSAPRSWKDWVSRGPAALQNVRRSVAAQLVTPWQEQMPSSGSREAAILREVYRFYSEVPAAKARFEALAELVAERLLSGSGETYRRGWITPRSGDGGADFIARLDIGSAFSSTRIVVLGQAKCQKLTTAVSGRDIARTVARLRRGWLGVFVTTSYFSDRMQVEIYDDEYPLLMVPGKRLAELVSQMMAERGYRQVSDFLKEVDAGYGERIQVRNASEILFQL